MRRAMISLWVVPKILVLLTLTSPAYAGDLVDAAADIGQAVFTDLERKAIRAYYQQRRTDDSRQHNHASHADRGKKGKSVKSLKANKHSEKGLPPGIAMKVHRGGALPPGIAKKNLPVDLENQLPPRSRYRRMELDRQIVLVDIASDIIVDVIDKIF